MSVVGIAITVPTIMFLLLGGVASDRFERRGLMVAADLLRAVAGLALAGLALAGALEVWHIALIAAIYGTGAAFFTPAFDALVPDIVPPDRLAQANALDQLVRPVVLRMAGPALGGLLVELASPAAAFLFDAATFAVSAGCLLAIGPLRVRDRDRELPLAAGRAAAPRTPRRVLGDLADGVREVTRHRWLWVNILLFTGIVFLVLGPQRALLPVLMDRRFHAAGAYGLVVSCGGLGAVAGATLTGTVRPVRRGLWAYAAGLLAALSIAGLGQADAMWQLAALVAAMGVGLESFQVTWDTSVQELVRPQALGRVAALDALGSLALLPASYALVGVAADRYGAPAVFATAGLGTAALLGVGLLVPDVRGYQAPTSPERV
jgi:DHA3 family tetracycline resistance protein-like MFS transporter